MLGSIIGTFYRNKLKNTNQTEFRVEKVIQRKDDVKWKAMMILLTIGVIKKISLYKISYFQEPYTRSKSKIEAELDLSIYATKPSIFC